MLLCPRLRGASTGSGGRAYALLEVKLLALPKLLMHALGLLRQLFERRVRRGHVRGPVPEEHAVPARVRDLLEPAGTEQGRPRNRMW